ncbi:MAG: TMEM14 family protein [Chlamydiia bacterium]|nr:TMEM14 family protein [Chlamydiia bacterium]
MTHVLKKIGFIIFIYSLIVCAGGVMGFVMKDSLPSLVMGSFFGLSLLFLSIKTMTFYRWALITATLLILCLDAFFSYRFLLSQSLFPAGIMLILTTAVLLFIMLQLKKLSRVAKSQK